MYNGCILQVWVNNGVFESQLIDRLVICYDSTVFSRGFRSVHWMDSPTVMAVNLQTELPANRVSMK